MAHDEWWALQQQLQTSYLPIVRALLDEEPALREPALAKIRGNVEILHRVLQQHPSHGEAPQCDLKMLRLYHDKIEQLLAAVRKATQPQEPPAQAPPPPMAPSVARLAPAAPAAPVAVRAPAVAAPGDTLLSVLHNGGGAAASSTSAQPCPEEEADDRAVGGTIRDVMYAWGDTPEPLEECTQLLLRQLAHWPTGAAALAPVAGGVALCGKRLRERFPAEYAEHTRWLRLKRAARAAEDEDGDDEAVAKRACGEGDEEAEGEDEPATAAEAPGAHQTERDAFQDARTEGMSTPEYEAYVRRRQAASLNHKAFWRRVIAAHQLAPATVFKSNGSLQPAAVFLARLATKHLQGVVEGANRAASPTGALSLRSQPLALAHYQQAVREARAGWGDASCAPAAPRAPGAAAPAAAPAAASAAVVARDGVV